MITFDTEDDSKGNVYIINFYDGKGHYTFDNEVDAIKFILRTNNVEWYAHNLEYDIINIFRNHLYLLELYYLQGRLLYAKLPNSRKIFYDTFNFSFASVKALGKTIGLEKLETDTFNNIDYCRRDCEIIYNYMKQFYKTVEQEIELKRKKATLAGISQTVYLYNYCPVTIGGMNTDEELLYGYYGGRCEAFHIGEVLQPIAEIDVNSMYPYVMHKYKYPVTQYFLSEKPETELYIADCTVTVKQCDIPVLPKRHEGKLLFGTGTFRTFATSVEINKAMECRQLQSIKYHIVYNFEYCDYIFKDFIQDYYTKRLEAKKRNDSFKSMYYKLFMNSVYGRFAMNNGIEVIAKKFDKGIYLDTYKNGLHRYLLTIDSDKNKNFAIPVFITAYARIELYNLIQNVLQNGYTPLYCDTDSVYFTYSNYEPLQDFMENIYSIFSVSENIGDVSLNIYKAGIFYGAKQYLVITYNDYEKIRCKGIPEGARKEFLTTGKTKRKKPVRLRTGLKAREETILNEWREEFIEQKTRYNKRTIVDKELMNTIPIILG